MTKERDLPCDRGAAGYDIKPPMTYDPYAPPQQHYPHGGGAPYGLLGTYERFGWKTTAAAVLIGLSVGFSVITVGMTTAMGKPTAEAGLLYLGIMGLFGIGTQLTSLGGGVLFLVWMHQASKNAHSLRGQALTTSPGWAVGWWFIPIASMWKPYQALTEIWRASDPDVAVGDESWRSRAVPGTFPLWWALYLVSGVVSLVGVGITAFAGLKQAGVESALTFEDATGNAVVAVSLFLSAMAAVAIISIMRQLQRRQEALSLQGADRAG